MAKESFSKGKAEAPKAPAKTQVKSADNIEDKAPRAKQEQRVTKPAPKKQGPSAKAR
jgi:hypothetical protein